MIKYFILVWHRFLTLMTTTSKRKTDFMNSQRLVWVQNLHIIFKVLQWINESDSSYCSSQPSSESIISQSCQFWVFVVHHQTNRVSVRESFSWMSSEFRPSAKNKFRNCWLQNHRVTIKYFSLTGWIFWESKILNFCPSTILMLLAQKLEQLSRDSSLCHKAYRSQLFTHTPWVLQSYTVLWVSILCHVVPLGYRHNLL